MRSSVRFRLIRLSNDFRGRVGARSRRSALVRASTLACITTAAASLRSGAGLVADAARLQRG
ncbi:hypothetical protein [Myceligenerans halotolerans]